MSTQLNVWKVVSVCPVCGWGFTHYKSQPKKCCSRKCQRSQCKATKKPVKCARRGCKNTFLSRIRDGKPQAYCSRYCANQR